MFEDFDWQPSPSFYDQVSYDAMISLGIGLCNMTEEFPNGLSIVDAVKATDFIGTSGRVSFDNVTGTRAAESLTFKVVNLLVNPSTASIEYSAPTTSLVKLATKEVQTLSPFVYAQGETEPPLPLPRLSIDYNLLGTSVRALGWTLAAVVILVSIWFGTWTYYYRKKHIVRVAQPVFLVLLCVGTALMASTIIPLSFQEPISKRTLDGACMAMPWLFVMGFATAFSSLYCKLRRINMVRPYRFRQSSS